MANFGIRVTAKSDNVLHATVFILNPDYYQFPRTHAFGLFLLWEPLKKAGFAVESPLNDFLPQQFIIGDFRARAPIVIESLHVRDFQQLRDHHSGERIRSYLLNDKQEFNRESELPQVKYEIKVRAADFISHLNPGQVWASDGREYDDMRHLLEKDDPAGKLILESTMDGKFHVIREGMEGGEMNEIRTRTANFPRAAAVIDQKLADGFTLVYRNFDSPFGTEIELLNEAGEEAELE